MHRTWCRGKRLLREHATKGVCKPLRSLVHLKTALIENPSLSRGATSLTQAKAVFRWHFASSSSAACRKVKKFYVLEAAHKDSCEIHQMTQREREILESLLAGPRQIREFSEEEDPVVRLAAAGLIELRNRLGGPEMAITRLGHRELLIAQISQ